MILNFKTTNIMPKLDKLIDKGNVTGIREAIRARRPNGVPLVDINHVTENELIRTGVLYTLARCQPTQDHPIRLSGDVVYDIIDTFLSVYDTAGNPVIDLNVTLGLNSNAFEYLLSLCQEGHLPLAHTRRLVERFINLRRADGSRAFDITHNGHTSPLIQAVLINDVHIVQALLDLRDADGELALDINFQLPWGVQGTALDVAYIGSYFYRPPNFIPNPEMIALLRGAGARRASEIGPQNPVVNRNLRPVTHQLEAKGLTTEVARFVENPQNTHAPEVERSVDLSIESLKAIYFGSPHWLPFEEIKKQIAAFINQAEKDRTFTAERLSHIRSGFDFVCRDNVNIRHIQSDLSMREILTLVWLGANDGKRLPSDYPTTLPVNQFNDLRKQALLEKFEAIVTTYYRNGTFSPSCLGGTRNLIVETLNRAHPSVFIATTREALNEMALEYVQNYLIEQLSRLPTPQQRLILSQWGDADEPAYRTFIDTNKDKLMDFLERHLGSLLDPNWFKTTKEYCGYLPAPIPHKPLRDLSRDIIALNPDEYWTNNQSKVLGWLKAATESIYKNVDGSFEEDFQMLSAYHRSYQYACKLGQEIIAIADDTSLEKMGPALVSLKKCAMTVFDIEDLGQLKANIDLLAAQYQEFQLMDTLEKNLDKESKRINALLNDMSLRQVEKGQITNLLINLKQQIGSAPAKEVYSHCGLLVNTVKNQFKERYGLWDEVPAVLRRILGIISTVIFPIAALVECTTERGHWATFFGTSGVVSVVEDLLPPLEQACMMPTH